MPLPSLLVDPNSQARALAAVNGFYVSGEEALESRMFNTAVGLTATIGVRFMLITGEVVRYNFTHTPNTAGTLDRQRFPLPEGFILNAVVFPSAGAPTGTTCLCVLRIVGGLTANAIGLGVLCQGAITASQELSWPLTLTTAGAATTGTQPGTVRSITGTNPAAGSEISETVPANKAWNVIAFHAQLVTSATVATRTPYLTVDDGTTLLTKNIANGSQGASQTVDYIWLHQGYQEAANGVVTAQLAPRLLVGAGFRLRTSTVSFQAGDDWGAPQYLVEEWSV